MDGKEDKSNENGKRELPPPLSSPIGPDILSKVPRKKRQKLVETVSKKGMTAEQIKEAAAVAMTQNHSSKSRPMFWTKEEDDALLKAMENFEANKNAWTLIANNVPGRTAKQCVQRWEKVLQPGLKKGRWSEKEDKILIDLVTSYRRMGKQLIWSQICQKLTSRSSKQCRERWRNQLDPTLNKSKWTIEEDNELRKWNKKYPKQWAKIARLIPGRNENMVKYRWKRLSQVDGDRMKKNSLIKAAINYADEVKAAGKTQGNSSNSNSKTNNAAADGGCLFPGCSKPCVGSKEKFCKQHSDKPIKVEENKPSSGKINSFAGSNFDLLCAQSLNQLSEINKMQQLNVGGKNEGGQIDPRFLLNQQLLALQALSQPNLMQSQGQFSQNSFSAQLEQQNRMLQQQILTEQINFQRSEQTRNELKLVEQQLDEQMKFQSQVMKKQKDLINQLELQREELQKIQKKIEDLRAEKEKLSQKQESEQKNSTISNFQKQQSNMLSNPFAGVPITAFSGNK